MRVRLALLVAVFLLCGYLSVVASQPSSHLDAAFASAVNFQRGSPISFHLIVCH